MIEVCNVNFRYNPEEQPVLTGLSLSLYPGEMTAIMGANGSGKSTLARLLNGLLIPEEGTVKIEGINTRDEDQYWYIRSRVGMVFQNPDNQIVGPTVEDDVAFGLENLRIEPREMHLRVRDALSAMGLEKYAKAVPGRLSGGEKQRVAIAGILAMNPQYIVFDEAGAMLDPKNRRDLANIMLKLKREGIGVIIITQDPEEAILADRLVILNQGRIVSMGSPQKVLSTELEQLEEYGLNTTTMNRIAHRVAKHSSEFPTNILTVDEMVRALC